MSVSLIGGISRLAATTPIEASERAIVYRSRTPSRVGILRRRQPAASEPSSARPITSRAAKMAMVSESPIDEPGPAPLVTEGALRTLTPTTTSVGRTARTPRCSRKATHPSQ